MRTAWYNQGMAIHHDKLAYGKLAPTREELSENDILKMLERLNADEENKNDAPEKAGGTAAGEKRKTK